MATMIIGDIHGNHKALKKCLSVACATESVTRIVQVGDLGNFVRGSEEADRKCYAICKKYGVEVLWGNHDAHHLTGFAGLVPHFDPREYIQPSLFAWVDDILVTHAGVSNYHTNDWISTPANVGVARGGWEKEGGILWRDDREESLSFEFKQIYGHTPRKRFKFHGKPFTDEMLGICIDVQRSGQAPYVIVDGDTITGPRQTWSIGGETGIDTGEGLMGTRVDSGSTPDASIGEFMMDSWFSSEGA